MKSENFLYDEIKFFESEEAQPQLTYLEDYEKRGLKELIEIYQDLEVQSLNTDIPTEVEGRKDVVRLLILRRLYIVDLNRFQFMLDELEEELAELREWAKNFKNHRHKEGVSYSEKPNW